MMRDHPQRARLLSRLKRGVSLYELLSDEFKGPSSLKFSFQALRFNGVIYSNRDPDDFHMGSLIKYYVQ